MQIAFSDSVKDLALALPGSTRVFEKFGIDYCCGGERSLAEACARARVEPNFIVGKLAQLEQTPLPTVNWVEAPLTRLIEHILNKHHVFTRAELTRLETLFVKVCAKHGAFQPALLKAEALLQALRDELLPHMQKEERVLFPYVKQAEEAVSIGRPLPIAPFGTVQNPVRMMMREHDTAGEMLREMRRLTNGYALPDEACASWRALYQGLQELEADLHEHIHLENNVLFPRALTLEAKA